VLWNSYITRGRGATIHQQDCPNVLNMTDCERLVVEVRDITQLSRILTRIENIPNVLEAQRVKAGVVQFSVFSCQ
jgi:(p)ppGpp synthase/HD superfamily hydrolase